MATLQLQRKALIAEARTLGQKAEGESRDFTAEESKRAAEIQAEVKSLDERIVNNDHAREAIKSMTSDDASSDGGGAGGASSTKAVAIGGGAQHPLAKAMLTAIQEKPGGAKAVTVTAGSVSVPANLGVVGQARDPHLLSSVVQFVEQTAAGQDSQPDGVSYLRQVSRTLAAAAVQRGGTKPESALSFERISQAFATLAHTLVVPNQWLQDVTQFAQLLQSEMVYGVMLAVDNMLLNDTTDENGDTLTGLLTTTGVGRTAYVGDAVLTVRRALGSLEAQGIAPNHVAMNPADWEAIETMKLTDGSYLLSDRPGGSDERRIWNTPVVLVPGLTEGTAIAGDFSTQSIGVAHRGPITLQWNPYSRDTTNETVLRVEGRFNPVITQPAAFSIATLTEAPA